MSKRLTKEEIMDEQNVYNAMDEYTRQESIAFVEWMSSLMESNYRGKNNWYCKDGRIRSTTELYQIFQKQQP